MEENRVRHSKAELTVMVEDDLDKARKEASNAVKQAERVREYVIAVLDGRPFKLRPSILLDLNRCAIEGLDAYAGVWRPAGIAIGDSEHTPPGGALSARTCGGNVRLRERSLGVENGRSPCIICHVEVELDSSFH